MRSALKKHFFLPKFFKSDDYAPKYLLPAQPSPLPGTMENATFALLTKKFNYLKAAFLTYHRILF